LAVAKEVLEAFNLKGEILPLSGGQATSVKVNEAVLKPVEDALHYGLLTPLVALYCPAMSIWIFYRGLHRYERTGN
jgi:nitric oxide synthase oxygenase domain/subunit